MTAITWRAVPSLTVAAPGVLGNDSDPERDPLTAALESGTSHGTLTLESNGSFVYRPAAGYVGLDSFTYHAYDGSLSSPAAKVTIAVNNEFVTGVITPPTNTEVTTDVEGDGATPSDVVETTVSMAGTASVSIGEGVITQQAPAGFGFFAEEVQIAASGASGETPLTIKFRLDASVIAAGENESTLQVFKDAIGPITTCADSSGRRRHRIRVSHAGLCSPTETWRLRFSHHRDPGGPSRGRRRTLRPRLWTTASRRTRTRR